MANVFLPAKDYADAMLMHIVNNYKMKNFIQRSYDSQLNNENAQKINVKRPPMFLATDGMAIKPQDIITGSEDLELSEYKNVHLKYNDLEWVQSMNDLLKSEMMKAAGNTLAQAIDKRIAEELLLIPDWLGAPGNKISDTEMLFEATARLQMNAVPSEDINGVVSYIDSPKLKKELMVTNISGINKDALLDASLLGEVSGASLYQTQNLPSVETGTRENGTIDGANQNVNYRDVNTNAYISQTLNVKGIGNNKTVKKGEVFTIAGVFAIQPLMKNNLGYLRQFVVLEDVTASGTGAATLKISPAIVVAGVNDSSGKSTTNDVHSNVSAKPANAAVVTFVGDAEKAYLIRAMAHKSAIQIASTNLMAPFTGESSFRRDDETGIGIRYWRGSDINTAEHYHRWDIHFGVKMMRNTFAVRVNGA